VFIKCWRASKRREHGDERAAASWLMKSPEGAPDPTWLCRNCGGAHVEWQPICTACGAFDGLAWQSVGKSRSMLTCAKDVTDND